jgi:pyruvate/2-oxoglutarate dehydrogenase complex dihydrolipoamide acyltransferase (E2) component
LTIEPILLPDLGASPVTLSVWFVEVGQEVYEGDRLVEVLVDGATFDVAAPCSGTLVEKTAFNEDVLTPGQTLGTIEKSRTP